MAAPYNITNMTSGNNVVEVLVSLNNNATDGWLGVFLLVAIFVIILISTKAADNLSSFSAASFMSAIFATLLSLMGMLNGYWVAGAYFLVVVSVVILYKNR